MNVHVSHAYKKIDIIVVFLLRLMEGMGRLQFSDLFIELTVTQQAAGVVGTFIRVLNYISF